MGALPAAFEDDPVPVGVLPLVWAKETEAAIIEMAVSAGMPFIVGLSNCYRQKPCGGFASGAVTCSSMKSGLMRALRN